MGVETLSCVDVSKLMRLYDEGRDLSKLIERRTAEVEDGQAKLSKAFDAMVSSVPEGISLRGVFFDDANELKSTFAGLEAQVEQVMTAPLTEEPKLAVGQKR